MKYRYLNLLIAVQICFNPSYLAAQNEPTGSINSPGVLETVLVTATGIPRAAESLNLGWSTIDEDSIQSTGHTHINEAFQQVSGAWISRGNGQEHLSALRSPVLTGAGGCGSTYMAQDGVSLRAAGFCNVNQLFDANSEFAEKIEVIKGPGTALYGSNAMHGVINIVSPSVPEISGGHLRLEFGPNAYQRLRLNQSWRADNSGLEINVLGAMDGGYKDDSGYDQQKLSLVHEYSTEKASFNTIFSATNLNQETAGFVSGDDAYKDKSQKKTNPNPEAFRDARSWRLQSNWSLDVDETRRLSVTPYLRDNNMRFIQHFLPWRAVEENSHQSVGVRSALHEDRDWGQLSYGVDGEFTQASLTEIQPTEFSPVQPRGVHYDYGVNAKTWAGFVQLSWNLSPTVTVDAGARYESTHYDYETNVAAGSACADGVSNCRFFRPSNSKDEYGDWSLNAGLGYRYQPEHKAYIRVASAFRAPQASEMYRLQQGQVQADLDSEQLGSMELGASGAFAQFSYRLDLWVMRKTDVIFQNPDRQNVCGARTSHHGIDSQFDYQISPQWQLSMVYSNALHRYDNAATLLGTRLKLKGNTIDTAPRHLGSARLEWQPNDRARLALEWIHLGRYFTDPDNLHIYPGHNLLNVRAKLDWSRHVSVGLRVLNVLDEEYAERADFGFGNERYFVGEPRSVFADLKYQW